MIELPKIEGFEWDKGNLRKNDKHGIDAAEAEQVFFDQRVLMAADDKHSQHEERYHALGKSKEGRLLHVVFTLRGGGKKIRIISARLMNRKERNVYETEKQKP